MTIEELRAQLAIVTNLKEKIDLTNTLAWRLQDVNPREAITLGQEAVKIAHKDDFERQPYQSGAAQGLLNIGSGYVRLAEYQEAMPFLADAAAIFAELGNNAGLIDATNIIGLIFLYIGDYASFTEYAFQALDLCRTSGDKARRTVLLNNIGHGYLRQGKFDEAVPYLKQSLALAEELGVTVSQGDAHDNLCAALRGVGDFEAALAHGRSSIVLYKQSERHVGLAEAWNNLGEVYLAMGDFDTAVASFRQSHQIAEKIGHRFEAVEAQLRIGKTWCQQKQYAKAKETGQQALAQADTIASPALQYKSHYLLYKAAHSLGNTAEALAHHIQFFKLKETVFNQDSDARKTALEAIYRVRQAQKEAEIYQLRSVELEQEVAERNRIAAELQQQNEELNAFAQTVAHDLKSPIALMAGFAEVLQGNLATLAPEDVTQIAHSIFAGGHKAAKIVDELLLLAGVRSQQIAPEPVDMTAVTADAIYQLRTEIEAKQGTLVKPDAFPLALGYAPWIEQVWKNYISNGLKYGGNPPEIALGFTKNTDGMIRFWVRDNGSGLKPAEQAQLFTEFTRLDHGKAKGHGLGLAIVRRIMEKLNGRVGVESAPGEGSLFYFELPRFHGGG